MSKESPSENIYEEQVSRFLETARRYFETG